SALGGAPGVRSARFAGEDASDEENLARLLRDLDGAEDRGVAYVCALAYVDGGGNEELVEGRCEGTLASEPRGDGGFGYDPAFVPTDGGYQDRTMAELSDDEKHVISHRGRAARALAARLGEGGACWGAEGVGGPGHIREGAGAEEGSAVGVRNTGQGSE